MKSTSNPLYLKMRFIQLCMKEGMLPEDHQRDFTEIIVDLIHVHLHVWESESRSHGHLYVNSIEFQDRFLSFLNYVYLRIIHEP